MVPNVPSERMVADRSDGGQDEEGWERVVRRSRTNESAGTRTQDLRIKSALLYRLSYTPFF